jgi:hypothetical protein
MVVALPMDEWSVKVSDGPPDLVPDDDGWTPWSGVVPLRLTADPPVTDRGGEPPAYVRQWHR